jgi:formylglycine-generating enzyme required for sulfatase activity
MLQKARAIAVMSVVLAVSLYSGCASAPEAAQTPQGPEVTIQGVQTPQGTEATIKGNVVCNRTTIPVPWDQTSQDADHYPVVFAFEGTPEISAQLAEIMDKYYPEQGLDCDAAQKFLDEFSARLRYSVAPGSLTDKMHKEVEWGSQILAVTGVLSEKDGKKWITVTKYEPATIKYPATMVAPDKPLLMPDNAPIPLKVNDSLTMKCVPIPAGRFLQGSPFYQQRYQDEFPHEVVLTKSYYMSETPVTQEVFEAVMGKNPSPANGPQCPVESAPWTDVTEFCRMLSEKNAMTVRIPTDPEWEYAARVGTSNPCFTEKYTDQISAAAVKGSTTPVKSMEPNAWGLYDMLCGGWTVTSTYKVDNARAKEIDPQGPPRGDGSIQSESTGPMHKSRGGYHYKFIRPNMHGAVSEGGGLWEGGTQIFRIVVEAAPVKPAAGTP